MKEKYLLIFDLIF